MKTFLKTLIGGALGLGALYVVGRVCFEAGKDVAEIERQLAKGEKPASEDPAAADDHLSGDEPNGQPDQDVVSDVEASINRAFDKGQQTGKDAGAIIAKHQKAMPAALGKIVDKVRNAKMFIRLKKAFDRKGERSPGILGSLLSNPDGARIEAFVRNGGVQINVTPRAA